MTGKKTHDLQQRIIEKRIDTTNADKDFDPRPDLKAAEEPGSRVERETHPERQPTRTDENDDPRLQGLNQESQHRKRRGRSEDQTG